MPPLAAEPLRHATLVDDAYRPLQITAFAFFHFIFSSPHAFGSPRSATQCFVLLSLVISRYYLAAISLSFDFMLRLFRFTSLITPLMIMLL